ncbi:hypothetical protein J2Z75_005156 [Rhizobium herbae]|uniref:Uncharacterized protein n=1 Tax=Rhizobium herbae TaxID=508661 RepID=A0ABS4EUL2_9HYPH|nr:hypothetical protein [Rhizobium herbae]
MRSTQQKFSENGNANEWNFANSTTSLPLPRSFILRGRLLAFMSRSPCLASRSSLLSKQIQSLETRYSAARSLGTAGRSGVAIVCKLPQCAFGLRPARSARGRGAPGSSSAKKAETSTSSVDAKASRAPTVTFSDPRSTRPTYERSISASRASRSCESPLATRSLRRFHPILCRTSMPVRRAYSMLDNRRTVSP